ncbi:MAG: protein kinase [Gemmataceae bacterium]
MLGHTYLGRYKTIRLLGEGGMGRVFLAHDTNLDRQVVIKVMHDHIAADPTFRERFQRETFLTAQFTHPYAVTVYDAYPNDSKGPFILMEYIQGETLDVVLNRNRRLDVVRVGRLLHMLCEVLQAAHAKGLIHRDLKPANLMVVDPDTPYEILKVMDFGLAKLLGPQSMSAVTNAEFAVGTPGYMCPEQARGEEMDHRGDLYAVGVILFELLTGQLPFAGRSTMDVLIAHATEEPPSFTTLGLMGLVPPAIERVVQAALAKDPNQRPRNARELSEAYAAALTSNSAEPSHKGAHPTARPPRGRSTMGGHGANGIASPVARSAPVAAPPLTPPPGMYPPLMPSAPDPIVVKAPQPTPPTVNDPFAVVHHLEAWMPEKIATYKLRGFIQDVGGEVVENVPGRISVRLGGKGCAYSTPNRGLSWFGLGRKPSIHLELQLTRGEGGRDNQLKITVVFRSPGNDLKTDTAWRAVCTQIYCDLRAYLMGQSNGRVDGTM